MEFLTPDGIKEDGSRLDTTKLVLMVKLALEPNIAVPTKAEASGNSQYEEANEEL